MNELFICQWCGYIEEVVIADENITSVRQCALESVIGGRGIRESGIRESGIRESGIRESARLLVGLSSPWSGNSEESPRLFIPCSNFVIWVPLKTFSACCLE